MPRCLFRRASALFIGSFFLLAQEYRATLTGRITDAQDAVVPNVKIVATQVETGAKSETVSATDGQFTLPFLQPGRYTVTAESSGFKRFVREALPLSAGERTALDIRLEIGQSAESVTVTGDAPLLETASASTGQVLGAIQVANMPMNGRTPLVLAQLSMGVVPSSDPRFNRPFDNSGPSGFSMGGAPAQDNELLVDGSPDTTSNLRVAYNPPVDAVDEVRVHTFEADAAYGHTGGGTVNVVLKGGTNTLHGTAYEFNQVSALDATPFFTNKAGLVKPVTRFNQFGVNSGGPIWIPKLYDGRNRMFWFFAWEGINDSFPEPISTTVPTQAERNGDFSALLKVPNSNSCVKDTGFNCYQLFDPASGAAEGARIRRQPIQGNIIGPQQISPIAKAVLQFYPLPNQPGGDDGRFNYLANSVRSDTFNNELARLDFVVSDRHKLFWNLRHNDRIENRGNLFNNIATGNYLGRVNWGSMADDVYTLNPTTVLNLRLNWTRFIESNTRSSNGFDPTKLGFPSIIAANSPRLVLPRFDFGSCGRTPRSGGFECIGDSGGDRTPFDIYQVFLSLVKTAGKHTLKMGTDLRLLRESSISYGNSAGNFSFNSSWTRGPLDSSTAAPLGQELAAFLMGMPTGGGGLDLNAYRTNTADYYALFLQDDFRVSSTLTLNLGLRYERDLATTERFNRSTNGFDTTTPNPIAAAAQAAYAKNQIPQIALNQFQVRGGLLFASPDNPAMYNTRAHYFSPRFGFAWTPAWLGGKTVFRGGAGVFVFPLGVAGGYQTGFSQSTSFVATNNGFLTPFATLANPFPSGIQQPTGSSLGLATYLGKNFEVFNPNPLNPYALRWNFGIQRQLPGQIVFETTYTGNHAVHLQTDRVQLNYVPGQYLSTSGTRDQATIDLLSGNVPNPFAGLIPGTNLNGSTVQRMQLLVPFPEFLGVNRTTGDPSGGIQIRKGSGGESYFHSLAVRVEKRFSHGFTFLTNYTYSKLMERTTYLNDSDPAPEKRISPDDRPQRVVFSSSYELPFGHGKRFDVSNSFLNHAVGGWVVNGIYTWQIGAPLDWKNVNPIFYGGNVHFDPRQVNGPAFDRSQFNTSSSQQLGFNIRTFPTRFGNVRVDGANNFDLSLLKNTRIKERLNFQLRLEAFNALNHPEFDAPDINPTSKTFGLITNQPNLARNLQLGARLVW